MERRLLLDYPREEAIQVVKAAFEQSTGINSYTEYDDNILGRTELSITSWGTEVRVRFPETEESEQTPIVINTSRVVGINITAQPRKYHNEYLSQIDALRGYSAEQISQHRDVQEKSNATEVSMHSIGKQIGVGSSSSSSTSTFFRFVAFLFGIPIFIGIVFFLGGYVISIIQNLGIPPSVPLALLILLPVALFVLHLINS